MSTSGPEVIESQAAGAVAPRPARVKRVEAETRDTVTLTLEGGAGFIPGQFNMLWAFGAGEAPISLSGDPARPGELVHTIRAVGPVTRRLASLGRGAVVGVRGPFGSGWPVREQAGRDLVIVGGGIGRAPRRPVIYHVMRHRADYRGVVILYGARSQDELLYARELERWRGRFDIRLRVTLDRGGPGWRGNVGVVTGLIPGVAFDPGSAAAFICGPEVMIRFTARELEQRGGPPAPIWGCLGRDKQWGGGLCGHCQYGPTFVCRDGPVYRLDRLAGLFGRREL